MTYKQVQEKQCIHRSTVLVWPCKRQNKIDQLKLKQIVKTPITHNSEFASQKSNWLRKVLRRLSMKMPFITQTKNVERFPKSIQSTFRRLEKQRRLSVTRLCQWFEYLQCLLSIGKSCTFMAQQTQQVIDLVMHYRYLMPSIGT